MVRGRIGRLIGFFVVSVAVALGATVGLQGVVGWEQNSYGPTGYRGIVSANFNTGTTAEEIIGDFGSAGVWAYHGGTWSQLTPSNPDWIIAVQFSASDYELVGDFGSLGMWWWNYSGYPGVWTQITTSNAEYGLAVDDDGDSREEIHVDFGSAGLWRYDYDTTTWSQLTASNPAGNGGRRTDLWTVGWEESVWDFGAQGLWVTYWYSGAPYWQQLTTSDPLSDMVAGDFVNDDGTDAEDELAVEFSSGIWVYDSDGAGTWTRITTSACNAMAPAKFGNNADTELVVAPTDYLPWYWGGLGGSWYQMSGTALEAGFLVPFDADGVTETSFVEHEVAGDFGSAGLWLYNYTGTNAQSWVRMTESNPVFMVASDYYGDGAKTALIAWFGSGTGMWIYRNGSWAKLTDTTPDNSTGW